MVGNSCQKNKGIVLKTLKVAKSYRWGRYKKKGPVQGKSKAESQIWRKETKEMKYKLHDKNGEISA